jgi:hypothetical protein
MSTLLQDAIVDATALREAALKTAEASIIEKYSGEVREALDNLLEQEEDPMAGMEDPAAAAAPPADPMAMPGGMDLGMPAEEGAPAEEIAEDVPLGAADGEKLCGCPEEGEAAKVSVNLDELQETVDNLHKELNEDEEMEFNEEDITAMLSEDDDEPETESAEEDDPDAPDEPDSEETEADDPLDVREELEISDDLIDSIVEKLTVDMGAELSGWAGRSNYDLKWEIEKEMAHRRSTDVEEELKDLKKAHEELVFESNQLKERTEQYEQVVRELRENLQEVNTSNARLLYTNRVLRNTSLNERQKIKIAEAISRAGSVAEAKTIYETLESAVPAQTKRAPQSLSEAISRPSSVIRATRKESAQPKDLFLDRMQKLAGIK